METLKITRRQALCAITAAAAGCNAPVSGSDPWGSGAYGSGSYSY